MGGCEGGKLPEKMKRNLKDETAKRRDRETPGEKAQIKKRRDGERIEGQKSRRSEGEKVRG